MKRFLAMAMSLVIGATSIWTTGLTTYAAEDTDPEEAVEVESGSVEEDVYDNIFGDDPVNKKDYYATFSIETNGVQKSWKYKINGAERVPVFTGYVTSPLQTVSDLNAYDPYNTYYNRYPVYEIVSGNQTLKGYKF